MQTASKRRSAIGTSAHESNASASAGSSGCRSRSSSSSCFRDTGGFTPIVGFKSAGATRTPE
ncbi:MAG: hypothetical protein U0270_07615 [Labilithrix sp.]